ncbi:hypothetical protein QT971_13300 [Microcoleus sp. herbarium19]|uniref:hypothetical protein n=1 Tax=unclassified Microcoleus TaxID=2642155 RepID=UPI002FD0AFD5
MKKVSDRSLANLTPFEGKWKYGATRTIRVPIVLADRVLALARKLDNGESFEKSQEPRLYSRIGELTADVNALGRKLLKAQHSLDRAEDEIADLKLELAAAKSELKRVSAENKKLRE